jgi:hypothetical protein
MTEKDNGVFLRWKNHVIATVGAPVRRMKANPVIIIPFANEVSKILRDRRHEHTKDYSGSSLQFYFRVGDAVEYETDTDPISSQDSLANATGNYRVNFTYINAGIYEISQQTVKLEMS